MEKYIDNSSFLKLLTPIRQTVTWCNLKGAKVVRIKIEVGKPPIIELEKIPFVMKRPAMYQKAGYFVIEENGCNVISKQEEASPK